MPRFLAVLAVFLLAHVIPTLPAVRRWLQARLGEGGFIGVYSLLSLALFAWLLREALLAPYAPLWFAGTWSYWFALVLLPLALFLLGSGALAPNPLSIAFATRPFHPATPGAVAFTRHPLLWGLGLWGLAHLPVNGHAVGLMLFGSLGAFALIGMGAVENRRRASLGEEQWQALAGPTSFLPFVAILRGRARWPTDRPSLIGGGLGLLVALVLLAGGHRWLFGRDPLGFL